MLSTHPLPEDDPALRPCPQDAVTFLRRFAPAGPWVLSAIGEGYGDVPTTTFQPGDESAMAAWIEARQGEQRNVYFLVGEPSHPLRKKAEKAEVACTRWLWVDLDANKALDWGDVASVAAEMAALRNRLDACPMPPTVIVHSGGGFQAYWHLDEPFVLGGDRARIAELEALNRSLAAVLGADHCHNVDRVMRLPGTINYPNAKKRTAGRKPALASLVLSVAGLSYPADRFRDLDAAVPPPMQDNNGCAIEGLPDHLQRQLRAAPAAGKRSEPFYAACCALFEHGLSEADAVAAFETVPGGVAEKFLARGDLPAEVARVHTKWQSKPRKTRQSASAANIDRKPAQADILVKLASDTATFFKAPDDTPYAAIEIGGHRETWPIRSRGFKQWLIYSYFLKTGRAPNTDALNQAQATISAMAQFGGREACVFTRTAEHNGKLYLDMADKAWRAIEIDAGGWHIIDRPPVHFVRRKGVLALPEPERGGSIDELRTLLNVASEDDFKLVVGWLLAAMYPRGPYPLLSLAGEAGTAKSSAAELLRSLVDPNVSPLRNTPSDERDLFISATNSGMLVLDNLSGISAALSDALCRVSTGGGFATRELHTNDEEMIFDVMRPMLITSVGEVVARSDLADRSILVTLTTIPRTQRMTKKAFGAALERARPRILGALLDGMVHGVRELPNVCLDDLPRMADFIVWATACEGAYWETGAIEAAFKRNADNAVDGILEGDLVAVALLAWLAARQNEPWRGRGEELLSELAIWAPEGSRRDRSWPRDATRLSSRLTLIAPSLRKRGITIERGRGKKARWIAVSAE